MRFVCGVTRSGEKRILAAESRPSLEHIEELLADAPSLTFDWGAEADFSACERTAQVILEYVTGRDEAHRLASRYVDAVVRGLATDKMWVLPVEEIEAWLKLNRILM